MCTLFRILHFFSDLRRFLDLNSAATAAHLLFNAFLFVSLSLFLNVISIICKIILVVIFS
jgi:hypothetical protein